jgi:hypothetical protein
MRWLMARATNANEARKRPPPHILLGIAPRANNLIHHKTETYAHPCRTGGDSPIGFAAHLGEM